MTLSVPQPVERTAPAEAGEPDLSLVVPLYNEAGNVARVMGPLLEALEASGIAYELIPVDNGSTDGTAAQLARCVAGRPRVRVCAVARNEGYGWGIIQGLRQARGRFIGYMSGDGQIQPQDPVRVYQALRAAGGAIGKITRIVRHDGWVRRLNSDCYNITCALLFGMGTRDMNGTPKIVARGLLDQLALSSKDWFIDAELMWKAQWLGVQVLEIPTEYLARPHGASKVRLSAVWEFARNMAAVRWGGRFRAWCAARTAGQSAARSEPARAS